MYHLNCVTFHLQCRTLLQFDYIEHAGEVCGVIAGFATGVLANIVKAKPPYSGIQTHILLMAGGYGLGLLLKAKETYVTTRRDAVLRDYIIRHPDLFPEPERKKYGEILMPWVPMR
ncbi:hypothetical protein KM043_013804 [Ampulex compressa]|nr:hypothetical protein KM043_013804 [Ampulex compressa]